MKLANKIVWITGASSGIGAASAIEFARNGCHLVLSGRNVERLKKVEQKCLQYPVKTYILPFELSDTHEIPALVEKVIQWGGRVDILFNNGGISQRSLTVETDLEVDRKIMETNYFSAAILTKKVLPHMIKQGEGYILATSSVTGLFGFPLRSAYSASKHAMKGFFETVRTENKKHGIRVSIFYPGRIKTNISLHALEKEGKEHGKMDQGQEKGIPAEKCARVIVKTVKRDKKDKLIARGETLMVWLKKYFPGLFYFITSRISPT